jgi:hypothetical protein
MIPPLEDGVLPEGIHDCTIDEIDRMFGGFQRSDRRIRLMEKLSAYLAEARSVSFIKAVIIDGSFVMAKDEPDDIDLIVVVPANFDLSQEMKPFEYNVTSKSAVRRGGYPFDLFMLPEGSAKYEEFLELFSRVNPAKHAIFTSRQRKGMLRVQP